MSGHTPHAENPFEKRVAFTIAVTAMIVAITSMLGKGFSTEAIVKTTEAANKWAYYQAKSVKKNIVENTGRVLEISSAEKEKENAKNHLTKLEEQSKRYEEEMVEIKNEAEKLDKEALNYLHHSTKAEYAMLFLEMGIVLSSLAILSKIKIFWFGGIGSTIIGTIILIITLMG